VGLLLNEPVFTSRHVGVAAEAFAAAVFAQCGVDISVQYGANQPEYDLIVARGEFLLKVSVKGSKDGGWGLTQSFLKDAQYHAAVDTWHARHKPRTVICFVQFHGVPVGAMPRVYLATPNEVAALLKAASGGRGDTILHERHKRGPKAAGAGTVDEIPETWRFSIERVNELLSA
jgi:Holliday junction resolvase-like predicted endonuclease